MSIRELLVPQSTEKPWANIFVNDVETNILNVAGKPILTDSEYNGVIFRQGGVSSRNVYATWPEIVNVVSNTNGCVTVYVDDSLSSPCLMISNLDCQNRVTFKPYRSNVNPIVVLKFDTDVQLTNPQNFCGIMQLVTNSVTTQNLVLTNANLLILQDGVQLLSSASCLVPALYISAGHGNILSVATGSVLNNSVSPAVPLIQVGSGSALILEILNATNLGGFSNNIIASDDGTANLTKIFDSSMPENFITNAGYTGSIGYGPVSLSKGTSYDDTVSPPLIGATHVQAAIDILKATAIFATGINYSDYLYWDTSTSSWLAGSASVHIGANSGFTQGFDCVAVGSQAGGLNQGNGSTALGFAAGTTNQGAQSVAVGYNSAQTGQGNYCVAIGAYAGQTGQVDTAIAIGVQSGNGSQAVGAIGIGDHAGNSSQSTNAVAVGGYSGASSQGIAAVAVGLQSGNSSQGANSVAIGAYAGQTTQPANSIILNATGAPLNGLSPSSLFVQPIRNAIGPNTLYYNPGTGEITYN